VACLARKVEDEVLRSNDRSDALAVTNVGDMDGDRVLDSVDVGEVAAVLTPERIDQRDVAARGNEAVGEVRADESKPAWDEDPLTPEDIGKFGIDH
jgi:hypothetical protein